MLDFSTENNLLILTYIPMRPWVLENLDRGEDISLKKKLFTFSKTDFNKSRNDKSNEEIIEFILGRLAGDYFKIEGRILRIRQSVFIHKDIRVSEDFFIAVQGASIFKKISELAVEDIFIGGEHPTAIPEKIFHKILKDFPTPYEIKKYVEARLGSVLSNYFDSASDVANKYERYMNKRKSIEGENLLAAFKEGELIKYEIILNKLEEMLRTANKYNEKQWQNEILEILLLIYPKYISVFSEVSIKDTYNNKNRRLDFLLVDANGNVDIVEIKRPFGKELLQNEYRENHIPSRELSGTVMQVEKYIFYLNKWGKTGEDKLTATYKAALPNDMVIKITNPGGMLIMGRDANFSGNQKGDFEIIKRKYKNIIDIITYDDLLRRLKLIITVLKGN